MNKNITQDAVQKIVDGENKGIAEVQQQALLQYLQSRVVNLALENDGLRALLKEHAPDALAEFDAPPAEEPEVKQPEDRKPRRQRAPRKPREDAPSE